MKTYKSRTGKRVLAAAAMLSSFAAAALAADPVTLTVWSDTARLSLFAAYDDQHETITLNVVTVDPKDLLAKIQLGLQSGAEVPDVIFMSDIGYTSQLATRGSNYLMDLTGKVPDAKLAEFYPNANSPCYVNGKLLCLRNDLAHMIVWYDEPLMKELGQTVPKTWEEFAALGAALGPKGYALGSAVEPYPLISYLVSSGCELAIPVEGATDTLKINATSDACVKAATMVDTMVANGSLTKTGPFDPPFVALAKSGKVPLIIGPTWFGEYVIKPTYEFKPGTLAASVPLVWDGQAQPVTWSWGGGTYGGYNKTAHPDEVLDLIVWAATDVSVQTNAVTMPAHAPSALAWGAKLKADAYYANAEVFDVEVASAAFSHPGYVSLRIDLSAAIAKTLSAAISGGGKAVDALPALQTELTNLAQLNKYQVQ